MVNNARKILLICTYSYTATKIASILVRVQRIIPHQSYSIWYSYYRYIPSNHTVCTIRNYTNKRQPQLIKKKTQLDSELAVLQKLQLKSINQQISKLFNHTNNNINNMSDKNGTTMNDVKIDIAGPAAVISPKLSPASQHAGIKRAHSTTNDKNIVVNVSNCDNDNDDDESSSDSDSSGDSDDDIPLMKIAAQQQKSNNNNNIGNKQQKSAPIKAVAKNMATSKLAKKAKKQVMSEADDDSDNNVDDMNSDDDDNDGNKTQRFSTSEVFDASRYETQTVVKPLVPLQGANKWYVPLLIYNCIQYNTLI